MSKIIDSIDVIIFVAVLVGAGFMLATGANMNLESKDAAIEKADFATKAVKDALQNAKYEGSEGHKILKRLAELPDEIEVHWSPEIKRREYQHGIFYHPKSVEDVREERGLELRFLPPINLQASSDIGRVRVFWEVPDQNTVPIKEFHVFRGPADSATLVGKVPGADRSFVDKNVAAGRLYKYHVRAVTDDRLLRKSNRATTAYSKPVDIRGARDYGLKLLKYDSSTKTARILVKRYVADVWHEKEFDAMVGKPIGIQDAGSGINYTTPCTVIRFEEGSKTVPEKRDEVAFDGQGRVLVGKNGQPITKNVSYKRVINTVKLIYRNELGETEELLLQQ